MKKRAFTMAEAVLVMTILGIIATIMITTLKPAEFKEKGLSVLAKKVMSEIDTATTQILLNNSSDGTMSNLYIPGSSTLFNVGTSAVNTTNSENLGKLYKKYLTATRKACNSDAACGACNNYSNKFFLKDGVCIGISAGKPASAVNTWFPGEANDTVETPGYGVIFFDVNGTEEPNTLGKDRFLMPLGAEGIKYAD
ncbi:type II secretion system protein [bacterium]|nr:type II secretion system protein [bacterium]